MLPDSPKPIDVRFFLLFIPVAYFSYLFHEFGHWSMGELLGNPMVYSMNSVWPRDGHYLQESHNVYVSIGGPGFSVLQAVIALFIIEKWGTLYVYPLAFFPMFSRFFSDFLGGFEKQDEAGMAAMMGTWKYLPAVIVLAILLAIIIRCSYRLNLDARTNGYVLTASTIGQLLVIGTYTCFRI